MKKYIVFAVLVMLPAVPTVTADVIHVPTEQPTIQAGIDAASPGDTVLVADGTYTGPGNRDIDFSGKEVTVRSENGRDFCIIDCQASSELLHRAFLLTSGEGPGAVIQGFSVINGFAPDDGDYYGGAILCWGSSPTIRDNFFTGNHAWNCGGAICCGGSPDWVGSPLIIGNYFYDNAGGESAGAICLYGGSPLVANNIFYRNTAQLLGGGAVLCASGWTTSTALIINNLFIENIGEYAMSGAGGGGLSVENYPSVTVVNCTFLDNFAAGYGNTVFVDDYSDLQMINCILWGGPYQIGYYDNPPLIEYSAVQDGFPGTGNLADDPAFATGPEGECYLSRTSAGQPVNSPCIDAGSGPVELICWTVDGQEYCLDRFTTRTDEIRDSGTVDMGFHYPARSSVEASLTCNPASGTLPFGCQMVATLTNRYPESTRRLAARINFDLAGGQSYTSWRAGYTNIAGGGAFLSSWVQNIPALPNLLGDSFFTLTAEDVTPAPYNQPPHLPSGDTGSSVCQVTGIAP